MVIVGCRAVVVVGVVVVGVVVVRGMAEWGSRCGCLIQHFLLSTWDRLGSCLRHIGSRTADAG